MTEPSTDNNIATPSITNNDDNTNSNLNVVENPTVTNPTSTLPNTTGTDKTA